MNATLRELDNATSIAWCGFVRIRPVDDQSLTGAPSDHYGATLNDNVILLSPPFHRAPPTGTLEIVAGTGSLTLTGHSPAVIVRPPNQLSGTCDSHRARALSLLDQWISEKPTDEARTDFERLKQSLEADRTSTRKLFGD